MSFAQKKLVGEGYHPEQLPQYNPTLWNDPFVVRYNNCYAYAFNDPYHCEWTEELAPGYKSGIELIQMIEKDPSNGLYHFIQALESDGCIYIESNTIDILDGYYPIYLVYNVAYGDPGYHFYRLDYDPETDKLGWSHKDCDGKISRKGRDFGGNMVDILDPSMVNQSGFDLGGAYFYVSYPGCQAGPDKLRITAEELTAQLTCETTDLSSVLDPTIA